MDFRNWKIHEFTADRIRLSYDGRSIGEGARIFGVIITVVAIILFFSEYEKDKMNFLLLGGVGFVMLGWGFVHSLKKGTAIIDKTDLILRVQILSLTGRKDDEISLDGVETVEFSSEWRSRGKNRGCRFFYQIRLCRDSDPGLLMVDQPAKEGTLKRAAQFACFFAVPLVDRTGQTVATTPYEELDCSF